MYRQDYLIFVEYKNKKQETKYYSFDSEKETEIMLEAVIKAYLLPMLLDKDVEEIRIKKSLIISEKAGKNEQL